MALTKVQSELTNTGIVNVLDYGAAMAGQELLLACYRSGQINERQWQGHIEDDPKLRDAWLGTAPLGV